VSQPAYFQNGKRIAVSWKVVPSQQNVRVHWSQERFSSPSDQAT